MTDPWLDSHGRFTEEFLAEVVARLIAVGWSREQAEEYVQVPEEVLRSVVADLTATLAWSQERAEAFVCQNSLGWQKGLPRIVVVAEAVQQRLHDDRIDTSWPACPDHRLHPLWLSRETLPPMWTCPATGKSFCALGDLVSDRSAS